MLAIEVEVPLAEWGQAWRGRIERRLQAFTERVRARAVRHVSGEILQRHTGGFAGSIRVGVRRIGEQIREVFLQSDHPAAAIQELGGRTSPHEIRPVRARALRFTVDGRVVFALVVHHPGSLIPARAPLGKAFEAEVAWLEEGLEADLSAALAVRPHG